MGTFIMFLKHKTKNKYKEMEKKNSLPDNSSRHQIAQLLDKGIYLQVYCWIFVRPNMINLHTCFHLKAFIFPAAALVR